MDDGSPVPGAHDGMAAFAAAGGLVRLIRNHEMGGGTPFTASPYDSTGAGGTTTLLFDPSTEAVVSVRPSLSGTLLNCAGGPTPWGTWLSCEETTVGPGSNHQRPHGYVFEVRPTDDGTVAPVPLKAMGRFVHEAAAVDPGTGIVYLTEDRGESGLYRFVPKRRNQLSAGGRLQMLAIRGKSGFDTRFGQSVGAPLEVTWVDIRNPDPVDAESNPSAVFQQGRAGGGATFARLEGAWWGNGSLYVVSTNGGAAYSGQVWRVTPGKRDRIELVFESPGQAVLDKPDNVTVTPRGCVLLCEDGDPTEQYLRVVGPDGRIFDLAKNAASGEFAGACFSPDGQWLFVNCQGPETTFAITGPWGAGPI